MYNPTFVPKDRAAIGGRGSPAWQFAIITIAMWLVYHHSQSFNYAFKTWPTVSPVNYQHVTHMLKNNIPSRIHRIPTLLLHVPGTTVHAHVHVQYLHLMNAQSKT